jgi:AAA domain
MSKDKIYATLSDFDPLPVDWFFPKLIPYGMLTIMEGDPGVGKSFIAMNLAATVSTGGKLPNGERVDKNGVLYCSTEDDPNYTIRPRIDAMGGDANRIRIQENYSPFDDEWFSLLRREIREHKAGFVVMDPFYAYVPSTADMYKPNEIRPMLAKLSAIAADSGAAIVLIRHLRKSKSDKAIYQGIGSIDVTAAVRASVLVAPHPEDPDSGVMVQLKHSVAPKDGGWAFKLIPRGEDEIPEFKWTGRINLTADELFSADSGPTALDRALEFLAQELTTGPKNAADIQKKAEAKLIAPRTLDRAKKELGVKAAKKGSSWEWSLKGRQGRQNSE